MIIECNNCNKQFTVPSKLIPNEGRLLQCSSCNHKWHFKKEIQFKKIKKIEEKKIKIEKKNNLSEKNTIEKKKIEEISEKNKINALNFILIFIISFIALIVLVDTFKKPISSFIPSIDFILQNLYETIKDIYLFFKDLL